VRRGKESAQLGCFRIIRVSYVLFLSFSFSDSGNIT
jgi:hypothetical protein